METTQTLRDSSKNEAAEVCIRRFTNFYRQMSLADNVDANACNARAGHADHLGRAAR